MQYKCEYDLVYCGEENLSAPAYSSIYLCIFLSLQWKFWTSASNCIKLFVPKSLRCYIIKACWWIHQQEVYQGQLPTSSTKWYTHITMTESFVLDLLQNQEEYKMHKKNHFMPKMSFSTSFHQKCNLYTHFNPSPAEPGYTPTLQTV